jgi:hypothetical protein
MLRNRLAPEETPLAFLPAAGNEEEEGDLFPNPRTSDGDR